MYYSFPYKWAYKVQADLNMHQQLTRVIWLADCSSHSFKGMHCHYKGCHRLCKWEGARNIPTDLEHPVVARELPRTGKLQTFDVDTISLSDNWNFKQSGRFYHIILPQPIKFQKWFHGKFQYSTWSHPMPLRHLTEPWQWRCTYIIRKKMQYGTEKVSKNIQILSFQRFE